MMFRGRYFPLFVVLFGISTRLLGQDSASVTGTVTDVSGRNRDQRRGDSQ